MPSFGAYFCAKVYKIAEDNQGNRLTFKIITGRSHKVREILQSEKKTNAENYMIPLYRGTKKSDALVRWTPRNGTWPPLAGKEKKPTAGGSGL